MSLLPSLDSNLCLSHWKAVSCTGAPSVRIMYWSSSLLLKKPSPS